MDDNTDQSDQLVNQSTQVWLDSYAQPPEKESRFKNKRLLLIAGLAIVGIVITAAIFALQSSTNCLTAADLSELTGSRVGETIDTKENFYTFTVAFAPSTTAYKDKIENNEVTAESLAKYLHKNSNKRYVIRLTAVSPGKTETLLAKERTEKVKNDLIASGINEASITVSNTVSIPSDELEQGDSFDGYVIVSIASSEQCK